MQFIMLFYFSILMGFKILYQETVNGTRPMYLKLYCVFFFTFLVLKRRTNIFV